MVLLWPSQQICHTSPCRHLLSGYLGIRPVKPGALQGDKGRQIVYNSGRIAAVTEPQVFMLPGCWFCLWQLRPGGLPCSCISPEQSLIKAHHAPACHFPCDGTQAKPSAIHKVCLRFCPGSRGNSAAPARATTSIRHCLKRRRYGQQDDLPHLRRAAGAGR